MKFLNSKKFENKFLKQIKKYVKNKNVNLSSVKNIKKIIEQYNSEFEFDYVISVSTLEHIDDLLSFFTAIKNKSEISTKHIHIIDFSNHFSGDMD